MESTRPWTAVDCTGASSVFLHVDLRGGVPHGEAIMTTLVSTFRLVAELFPRPIGRSHHV